MQIKKTINRLKKPVNTSETSELLFSIFFKDWSIRDLLVCIIMLQLFILITVALK